MKFLKAALALAATTLFAHPAAAQTAGLAAMKPVVSCESLLSRSPSGAKLDGASVVAGAQPYCKVTGVIAPAIRFEVRLPSERWTQRYLQTGCGALCGSLNIRPDKTAGCAPVTNGEIALASTDMGHSGMGLEWGGNAQQREDFAHRGVHLTAVAAKELIEAYYGQTPRYSYFAGCSDGGREALIEAQRYPDDFDGISAGAPALNFSVQNSFHHAWMALSNSGPDGQALLNPADLVPLHEAAIKACDAMDGLVDGLLSDPRVCRFNPAATICKGPYVEGQCLTAAQAEAARRIYAGPRTPDGKRLVAGSMMPGSELSWAGVFVPRAKGQSIFSVKIALDTINGLLFTPNPSPPMTLVNWRFDAANFASLEAARRLYNADNPDLSGFQRSGGRLIMWHGWSDPHISPVNTIEYHKAVGRVMGNAVRDSFMQTFLIPGMYHCGGGDGFSEFPALAALMDWVENGKRPDVMVAQSVRGAARSRPIYAWPKVARYNGSGPVDQAASFHAVQPRGAEAAVSWLGKH